MYCRTCEEPKNLISIDAVAGLQELLINLIGINVNQLFPMICWKCVTKIQDFNDFRAKCLQVDLKLAELSDVKEVLETFEVEIVDDETEEKTTIELSVVEENKSGVRHICTICGRNYVSKRNLNRHQKNQLSNALPYEICVHCGKNVPRTQIGVHTANHLKTQTYTCDICGVFFHHKEPLRAHMLNQ